MHLCLLQFVRQTNFFICDHQLIKICIQMAETRQNSFSVLSFQFFYWSFISIASFILLNVVLAIIVEAYAVVKRKNMEVKSMGTDILEVKWKTYIEISDAFCNFLCLLTWTCRFLETPEDAFTTVYLSQTCLCLTENWKKYSWKLLKSGFVWAR